MTQEPYKLPNGCILHPGGKVRLPAEQIWLIPEEDIKKFELTLGDDYSPYSEVIERNNMLSSKDNNYLTTRDGNKIPFEVKYDAQCGSFLAVSQIGNLVGEGETEPESVGALKRLVASRERRSGSWSAYTRSREHGKL